MKPKHKLVLKTQSTIETCLSMCLISLLEYKGIKVKRDEEINILIEGIKFTKIDYSTGHLAYVCKNYDVEIEQIIDYPIFYKLLSEYKYPKNFVLLNRKVNKSFINKISNKLPFIIYIDQYYLVGLHLPHFVILENINDKNASILDPWDGRRKILSTHLFFRAIQSLRNKLKISPKIITLA